jgi:ribA/ribD-fused uncharacterized protein
VDRAANGVVTRTTSAVTLDVDPSTCNRKGDVINDFRGRHYFLSNFYRHPVRIGGDVFPTAEHCYQALKAVDPRDRAWVISSETPLVAKQRGRKVRVVDYWSDVRVLVMEQVLAAKFADRDLAARLVATHPHTLVEGNTWHDQYWGNCHCGRCPGDGENVLGVALMQLRDELRGHRG